MGEETDGQPHTPESKPQVNNGKDLLERMAGFHPETKRMVEELTFQGLGRAIVQRVFEKVNSENLSEEQLFAKTVADTKGYKYTPETTREGYQTLGIILPCNKDNSQHVVILTDGSIFIIEQPDSVESVDHYKSELSLSDAGFKIYEDIQLPILRHSLASKNYFPSSETVFYKLVASSADPEQKDLIVSQTETALKLAREIKTEKETAILDAADTVAGIYNELFYPPQSPETPPPQPEQPSTPPQQE